MNDSKKRGPGRPPKPGGRMVQISLRLTPTMLAELEDQALQLRTCRATLARRAIKRFLLALHE